MGLFDKLRSVLTGSFNKVEKEVGQKLAIRSTDVIFPKLPESFDEFMQLPQAALGTPADTAALTVVAFSCYPKNKELALQILAYLRGPRPLSGIDKQFYEERFSEKDYVPRSYFKGATPSNDYEPSMPYTVSPFTNPHSDIQANMKRIWLTSGGADSPRYVDVRLAKDGKWYLWEQYILVDIRKPESSNPWA